MQIEHGGARIELRVERAFLHGKGEFSGNLDVELSATPLLSHRDMIANIAARVVDSSAPLQLLAHRARQGGVELTFDAREQLDGAPSALSVELFWDQRTIGTTAVIVGSEPIARRGDPSVEASAGGGSKPLYWILLALILAGAVAYILSS